MSPARHFIDERVAMVRNEITHELGAWYKERRKPGGRFRTPELDVLWSVELKRHVSRITDEAFKEARKIVAESNFDAIECMNEAGESAVKSARILIQVMNRLDESVRKHWYPDEEQVRDTSLDELNTVTKNTLSD